MKFKIGDKVKITNSNSPSGFIQRTISKTGRVTDINTRVFGFPCLLVNFSIKDSKEVWNNIGDITSIWFYESELEPCLVKGEQLLLFEM